MGMFSKIIQQMVQSGVISPVKNSVPEVHDVTVEGIKKKFNKGTNVSYSGIRTTSKGLLTDVNVEKKTLLGS
jgi:predicted transcriptional regulator